MTNMKLTSKYYIKIHDKNLPGESGWKCDFEMQTNNLKDFFKKEDLSWIDKFVTYEKIFQEVWDENGYKSGYTDPLDVREFEVVNLNGKYSFRRIEKEMEK